MDERIDVLGKRTVSDGVVEVSDEVSRGYRVVEEVGDDGSVESQLVWHGLILMTALGCPQALF